MKSLWRLWGRGFVRQARAVGTTNASLMSAAALRALRFPRQHVELLGLELFERYVIGADDANPLFHLSHRHYLSTSFTQRERVVSALAHHRFEDERYGSAYKEAVYRHGGIDVWERDVDGVRYVLRLRAGVELRHEGGLSVVLCADATVLCEMSYAWVDGTLLGFGDSTLPFITRNQSIHRDAPALRRFRHAFPQNSPMYFCLAAVHGIVLAHGIGHVAGIRHDRQVAFEERFAKSFRHSYCDFWCSFGGAVESGEVAHLMQVPLVLPPIATIAPKHRKRALERRRHWSEIVRGAREAVRPHLRTPEAAGASSSRTAAPTSLMEMNAMLLLMASLVA